MAMRCSAGRNCTAPVPLTLAGEQMCVVHFALKVEEECQEIRRETAKAFSSERMQSASTLITETGQKLLMASVSGMRLSHETKMRVVNTLLTLINLRENLDALALRQTQGPARAVHAS